MKTNMNPKSLKNLKSCKPGETHNSRGRTKGVKNWDTILRELFESRKYSQTEIAASIINQAREGNLKAAEFIVERMDGAPKPNDGVSGLDVTVNFKRESTDE